MRLEALGFGAKSLKNSSSVGPTNLHPTRKPLTLCVGKVRGYVRTRRKVIIVRHRTYVCYFAQREFLNL